MMRQLIIVGLGGAAGSMLRYGVYQFTKSGSFPYATLLINIFGSLLIGLIMGLAMKQAALDTNWRLFLATGLCGGFTTFSAFSYENLQLLQNGRTGAALLYIGLSLIAGIGAAWLGFRLVHNS